LPSGSSRGPSPSTNQTRCPSAWGTTRISEKGIDLGAILGRLLDLVVVAGVRDQRLTSFFVGRFAHCRAQSGDFPCPRSSSSNVCLANLQFQTPARSLRSEQFGKCLRDCVSNAAPKVTCDLIGTLPINFRSPLNRLKRNPGHLTLPGFCRLLHQLVGSCDAGGGAGGQLPPRLTWSVRVSMPLLADAHSQDIPQHGMRLEVIRNSAPTRPFERNPTPIVMRDVPKPRRKERPGFHVDTDAARATPSHSKDALADVPFLASRMCRVTVL
jgi:hypothetical protein